MKKFFLTLTPTLFILSILVVLVYPVSTEAFTLTVFKSGASSGKITSNPDGIDCGTNCSGEYSNITITLNATPDPNDPGSIFIGWTGDCTGTGDCNVMMDQNKLVTANFAHGWRSPLYGSPDCQVGIGRFDPACWLPINVGDVPQSKLGPLSIGSPSRGGLIVDAGAYIRGKLILPPAVDARIGSVLTLMANDGSAGWARPLTLTCENKTDINGLITLQPNTELSWKTATSTCAAGYKVTGGGINILSSPDYDPIYTESYQSLLANEEAWVGRLRGASSETLHAKVYARCCKF